MMVEPGMDVLLAHVDSKYTLASVSAKRARKILINNRGSLVNPVTVALQEIADGKITWEREDEDEPEYNLTPATSGVGGMIDLDDDSDLHSGEGHENE